MSSERGAARLAVLTAALALAAPGLARGQDAPPPADPSMEQARAHFERGTSLARDGRCDLARVEFEASLALVPRPNTYFNLARCDERLERHADALREYLAFLDLADPSDGHRNVVRDRVGALRREVATLSVEADVDGAEVLLDGVTLGPAPTSRFVEPGTYEIVVRHEGYDAATRTIALSRGETSTLILTLARTPEPVADAVDTEPVAEWESPPVAPAESPRRARAVLHRGTFYGGLALTGSALVFGASFGIHALRERAAGEHIDPLDADARAAAQARVRAASQVADIGYATTLGLAVATTIVGVFTDFHGTEEESAVRVTATASTSGLGVGVVGRFR